MTQWIKNGGNIPGPRVQRVASGTGVEVGGDSNTSGERAVVVVLLPPDVVVGGHRAEVVGTGVLAVLGRAAGRVVL